MKKILFSIVLFFSISLHLMAQCVVWAPLTSQDDIDNFSNNYPNCTVIEGSLRIEAENSSITSLQGLSQITSVESFLRIQGTQLVNLEGLENLTSVGTEFVGIQLVANSVLEDISVLSDISTSSLILEDNPVLTNLDGVQSIETLSSLTLKDNPLLTDLDGVQSIETLRQLFISDNGLITDLTIFESLVTVGDLRIGGNVQSLNGLENLTAAGWVSIGPNDYLSNLDGLNGLESVARLFIEGCSNLQSLQGLNNLITIHNRGGIANNENLLDLSGLDNLSFIHWFNLSNNGGMTNMSGIENLIQIDSILEISNNDILTDITAIENINLADDLDRLEIESNDLLSTCHVTSICDYLAIGGDHIISGNNSNCMNPVEVFNACNSGPETTILVGNVWADFDINCMNSAGDEVIPYTLLELTADNFSFTFATDVMGNYEVVVQPGTYNLRIISPSIFLTPCLEETTIVASGSGETINTDFFIMADGTCSFIDWDLNLLNLRICGIRRAVLDFCNLGAPSSEDIVFTLDLGEFVTLESASMNYTTDINGNIQFVLDDLDFLECGTIELYLFTDCDDVSLGDILCLDVSLTGVEICEPDGQWDGSTTEVTGYCEGDSIYFELQNIGSGDMATPAQFKVEILIEDIVLLFQDGTYDLESGESIQYSFPIIGSGFHLKADQTVGHPVLNSATATVANCESSMDDIIFNFFPNNNGDPFSNTFCAVAFNSYDPNQKTAIPVGTSDAHFIEDDWELNYTIEFQNTGNDVAFEVVIRDAISEHLDLTTLKVRGATHDFTWDLNEDRELVFTFANILLPDSTTNLRESQGHVNYSITPKEDLTPLTQIENEAAIYFDFNDPIITNTVFHTIRKPVVTNIDNLEWCSGDVFDGVAITQDTWVTSITEFDEYDSAQLTYLEVVDPIQVTQTVEVAIGETFQNVLISGDTTIVISELTEHGCDSIVTYQVNTTVLNTFETENTLNLVSVFPNPASKQLFIDVSNIDQSQTWTLRNTVGSPIWRKTFTPFESLKMISLEGLPSGVYLLEGRTDEDQKVWKIIVGNNND